MPYRPHRKELLLGKTQHCPVQYVDNVQGFYFVNNKILLKLSMEDGRILIFVWARIAVF